MRIKADVSRCTWTHKHTHIMNMFCVLPQGRTDTHQHSNVLEQNLTPILSQLRRPWLQVSKYSDDNFPFTVSFHKNLPQHKNGKGGISWEPSPDITMSLPYSCAQHLSCLWKPSEQTVLRPQQLAMSANSRKLTTLVKGLALPRKTKLTPAQVSCRHSPHSTHSGGCVEH